MVKKDGMILEKQHRVGAVTSLIPMGRDLGLGYRVRPPSSQEGDRGVETK